MKFFSYLFSRNKSKKNNLSQQLREVVGYYPNDLSPFIEALTHKSINVSHNYERLEFLGDAILDALVAEQLFRQFPKYGEGELTQLKSKLVSRKNLNTIGQQLGLDLFITSSFKRKELPESVFGNVLEALIGAIYLDGGRDKVYQFIAQHITNNVTDDSVIEIENYKGKLLEWGNKNLKRIEFVTNPSNNGFSATVTIEGDEIAIGVGRNKKQAEQEAARLAFKGLTDGF